MRFNREIFVSNLEFLLECNKIKPSAIDTEAKMSIGYTTRLLKKDSQTVPGVDYIMAAAELLKENVSVLLTIDLKSLDNADRYKLNVEEKLHKDTISGKIEWGIYPLSEILNPNGIEFILSSMRPFVTKLFKVNGKTEVICKSKLHKDDYVTVSSACIYTQLTKDNALAIIPVRIDGSTDTGFNFHYNGYEIYISLPSDKVRGFDSVLSGAIGYGEIDSLYQLVMKQYEASLIDDDVKNVLDAFLQLGDDE